MATAHTTLPDLADQIVGLVDNLTQAETPADLIEEIEALHQRLGVPMRPRSQWGSLYPVEASKPQAGDLWTDALSDFGVLVVITGGPLPCAAMGECWQGTAKDTDTVIEHVTPRDGWRLVERDGKPWEGVA